VLESPLALRKEAFEFPVALREDVIDHHVATLRDDIRDPQARHFPVSCTSAHAQAVSLNCGESASGG
jgi:hypothetical protein